MLETRDCVLATCNLNQWALDFEGNFNRIKESIKIAKELGATYRTGPELEICGYGCEDHFLESDTFLHSEESLAKILPLSYNILVDVGCPIFHNGVRYNCRVFCLNGRILLIRPKMVLADDGNYREARYFSPWQHKRTVEIHQLSPLLRISSSTVDGDHQTTVPFGDAIIATNETTLASEICEELWCPQSPGVEYCLAGVEIISNGSGSHHNLYKLHNRIDLIRSCMQKCGGVYLFANQRGCDGGRLYFDGSSAICLNGDIINQASQFSLKDVEVIASLIDLNDVQRYRQTSNSSQLQASHIQAYPRVDAEFSLLTSFNRKSRCNIIRQIPRSDIFGCVTDGYERSSLNSQPYAVHRPEEECLLGPACWLWDYLRRSGARGFMLPLSGGADSAAVAAIVFTMCNLVMAELRSESNNEVKADVLRILGLNELPDDFNAKSLCNMILHTLYIGTENSSRLTQRRAEALASDVSSYHNAVNIQSIVNAVHAMFSAVFPSHTPRYKVHGGSHVEDVALQNIQARLRMVTSYLFAQLLPWVRSNQPSGFLLVLGSGNVDEALRGYMTKYDCSSADVNPIGSISKSDLNKALKFASKAFGIKSLHEIAVAAPTAELQPLGNDVSDEGGYSQTDEADMGMTYDELSVYGILRKVSLCGPVSMFLKLIKMWTHMAVSDIAAKVKKFFFYYSINRHKLTTLTPSVHCEKYSPDDNRYDLRPFLYNPKWERQFESIDKIVTKYE